MSLFDELRKRARLIAGPVLGVSLVGYFAYHLVQGDRGLLAWLRLSQQLAEAQVTLSTVRAERQALEHRVALLRPEQIDRDMLDERARATLNLAGPNEIVVFRPTRGH
jgi:cell division protein FtsB